MAKGIPAYQVEDHSILSSDGETSLFIRHYKRGTPRLHFLIVHGALEHSGRHQELIDFWLKSYPDVAVTTFDHVGHGRSGGPRAYMKSFHVYVQDFLKVGEFMHNQGWENCRTFICAHSLGGLIALTGLLDSSYQWPYRIDGLILSSPCIKVKKLFGLSADAMLMKLSQLAPKLHLPMIFRGAHLTRDVKRANDFDTDSLIPKFITTRMVQEIIEATNKIRGQSYYLKVPSLFLIGGVDCVVDPESTTLFAHGVDKRLVQVIQYPKHHHELWNEIDRQDIFRSMKDWVDKQMKEKQ